MTARPVSSNALVRAVPVRSGWCVGCPTPRVPVAGGPRRAGRPRVWSDDRGTWPGVGLPPPPPRSPVSRRPDDAYVRGLTRLPPGSGPNNDYAGVPATITPRPAHDNGPERHDNRP